MSTPAPLRIVTFNNVPVAYQLTQGWAAHAGHKVVLAVTSPGPKVRRSTGYREIAAMAGEHNVELLVTTRLKTVATPILKALAPDLIVSFSFPWLLPPELLATARLGAVNLHPTLLPAYRGPNSARQFFEVAPRIGATAHWIDGNFDTGRILAQHGAEMPHPCTRETVYAAWGPTMQAALAEGVARAIAGDPGRPQPTEGASYTKEFSDDEYTLDLSESAYRLQCKTFALSFLGERPVLATLGGQTWHVKQIDLLDRRNDAPPGHVIDRDETGIIAQTGDGVVRFVGAPLSA